MLSRKNINEKLKRLEQQKQRFSIRKLTIGAASVLIGLVFFGMGSQSVHADKITSPQVVKNTEVKATQPSTNKTSTPEVTNKAQEAAILTGNQKKFQPSTPVKAATPNSQQVTSTSASKVQVAATTNTTNTPAVQANVSQTTEHVANETELQNALNNTNINNIVLDGNITNNSNSTFSLNNGTARQLTISGKQSDGTNASWNTGSGYVYLGSGTESNNKQWDISFEDIDITSTNSNGWSPVSLSDGVTGNISFNNVTNGGNGVLVYAPSANVTVQNTSSKPASSATDPNITANNVNIGDNVNLVTTQNNYNDGNVYANRNITVTGKNISLNSQADSSGSTSDAATNLYAGGNIDFKTGSDAILTAASSQSNNVNNLNINGTLTVEKDANVVVNSNVTANNVSTPTGFNSYSFPSGCSSITLVNNGAVIDGNLTINATAVPNSSGVVAGIGVQGNPSNAADVIIGSTGKYVVNATNSRDTRGIFYCADNHTVGLAEGAQAQFNMGHGVSNAIFRADNVILKPNASINITTYQDNNGNSNNGIQSDGAGDHSGPIVVGWSPTGSADNSSFVNNTHATIGIDKDANLTIIRKTDSNSKQANSPLIDFGSNGINGFSMNLTMNGGRMDLEDALQMDSHSGTPLAGSASYLGSEKEIFPMGMIVMFGTSSSDYVKITDPELFKMVRTGAQKGMLFRLEGTTNSINVASSDGEAIPLDYATVGGVKYSNGKVSTNTAYKWNITNLNTVNKMGNWAANYNNKGGSTSDAPDSWSEGVPFGEAQASVTFAPVALSDEPSDLSTPADFNNYFNWWSASNVAMGSDLIPDADKNDPKGGTITVNENAVLTPADAEQAITNKADLTNVSTYTWDKNDTPSTAKPGTFDGKVIVTYADKSEDVVPVKVIVKSLADEYTPEGQTVNVKKGQTPNAEEGIKNTNELPKGTKYTWKDTPDTSTVGTKSATIVVTYPDGSKDEVPVKVVVTDNSQPAEKPDSEKYEPEGQTVNVKKGQTPNPEEGIKNTNDMPKGTKYTWKTTPDTSTVGTKSATIVVTYPDGSKDEVPVKVVVTDNSQPAEKPDSEKYEPEGQTVNVKKGQTPNPEEGIKNTNDMPKGTKYTWKTTPDTSTVGTKSATIVVTYPDGSKDEVPVKVVVTKDETQPVTPITPEQPNTPENPTNTTKVIEPTNPDDPNQKDLFKHVTRTIIIKEPGKKAKKITQTATFTRNKTINTATGEVISYGNWTPSTRTLDKVTTPNVKGYTKHIDGDLNTIEVSPTSADTVVKVTYTRKPKATEPNPTNTNHSTHTKRVNTFTHESNKISHSNNGFDYNNGPKAITVPVNNRSTDQIISWLRNNGYQVTVNANGEITSIIKVNENKVYNYTISLKGKLILTSITSLENSSKANNSMINSLSTSQNGKESQSTSMKELPQTGSKDDDLASIGLAMATISGLLGLIVDRKRKQQ
ncbi:Rib/alpha-like domain-containing protein [Lactobacillus intestinalis]|uniref:Rib/alpha-like domain-containing protein n=9 Tax=Lactobacillus intestinalis TaxID=151781 RepID=UPI0025B1B5B2|nr:Rib/alpha-like domain-containing protein [Lactobacillus intestinalis]